MHRFYPMLVSLYYPTSSFSPILDSLHSYTTALPILTEPSRSTAYPYCLTLIWPGLRSPKLGYMCTGRPDTTIVTMLPSPSMLMSLSLSSSLSEPSTASSATLSSSSIPTLTIINTGSDISAGALAGGVVGGFAVGAIISSAVTFFVLRHRHKTGATTPDNGGNNNNVPQVNQPQPPNAHIAQQASPSPGAIATETSRNAAGTSTAFYLSGTTVPESVYTTNNQLSPSPNTGTQSTPAPPEEQQQQQQHVQSGSMPIYSTQTSPTAAHTQTEAPPHMMPQFQPWLQQSAQHYPQYVAELDPNARQAVPPGHPGYPAQ